MLCPLADYRAVVTSDKKADNGYYLVEWTSDPFTCQESGELWCNGNYLNPVPRAPKWYTKSALADEHLLHHVVLGKIEMVPISDEHELPNSLPKASKRKAISKQALKISTDSDDFIIDEIICRESLEDPEYERYDTELDDDDDGDGDDD